MGFVLASFLAGGGLVLETTAMAEDKTCQVAPGATVNVNICCPQGAAIKGCSCKALEAAKAKATQDAAALEAAKAKAAEDARALEAAKAKAAEDARALEAAKAKAAEDARALEAAKAKAAQDAAAHDEAQAALESEAAPRSWELGAGFLLTLVGVAERGKTPTSGRFGVRYVFRSEATLQPFLGLTQDLGTLSNGAFAYSAGVEGGLRAAFGWPFVQAVVRGKYVVPRFRHDSHGLSVEAGGGFGINCNKRTGVLIEALYDRGGFPPGSGLHRLNLGLSLLLRL